MFLSSIELENLLSFGKTQLELQSLNVLIGANATGKSNLIRALRLVQALPSRDGLSRAIAEGGGTSGWINQRTKAIARIHLAGSLSSTFEYALSFQATGQSFEIVREAFSGVFYRRRSAYKLDSATSLAERVADSLLDLEENPDWPRLLPQVSVLAEVRHPNEAALRKLTEAFEAIRLYWEFHTGPRSSARNGIAATALGAYLSEDGGNLALVLNELNGHRLLDRVNEYLIQLFDQFVRVFVLTRNGITQLYVEEKSVSTPLSAVSLSDGTLRLLCLLAVLLDPTPPPLVCIEEPETGLHPDAIRMVAELLVEASERTQLIVTTHSPALVDALSSQPESVVVCERDFDGFTKFSRLKSADLDEWLERYSLGQLWQKGEIGGNRW